MKKMDKIYVAGHKGLVGSALLRALNQDGYQNIIYRTHQELDLTQQDKVKTFFDSERPDYVFLAAAKVGGIHANNTYRAQFIYENLSIQLNVIEAAREFGCQRLLFLGSSCIYPRHCPQPMKEEHLLTSPLESTNEPYAIAKIAGIKLCEAYNSQYGMQYLPVMPTNLYGPHDNFDLETSHVIPALMRKIHDAKNNNQKSVTIWGSGKPLREFLYVDDMVSACLFLMNTPQQKSMINIGSGEEFSIEDVTKILCRIIGFQGKIEYDASKPDGTPRKLLDCSQLHDLGWKPKFSLEEGLRVTYEWYKETLVFSQLIDEAM